jgi:hypothetical protein
MEHYSRNNSRHKAGGLWLLRGFGFGKLSVIGDLAREMNLWQDASSWHISYHTFCNFHFPRRNATIPITAINDWEIAMAQKIPLEPMLV